MSFVGCGGGEATGSLGVEAQPKRAEIAMRAVRIFMALERAMERDLTPRSTKSRKMLVGSNFGASPHSAFQRRSR